MQLTAEKTFIAALVIGALLACKSFSGGGDDDKKAEDETSEKSDEAGGDKVGVKECDEFLDKYEKCLTSSTKIPSAQKETYKESVKTMRESYKSAASTPGGKDTLKATCEQSLKTTKEAMKAFNCEW